MEGTIQMGSIQLALSDAAKAEALRGVLARSAQREVVCMDRPDLDSACVVVVDQAHFSVLPLPLSKPDRVILLASSATRKPGRADSKANKPICPGASG